MQGMRGVVGFFIFLALVLPPAVRADTIVLVTGERIEGTVTKTQDGYIYFRTPKGEYRVRQDLVLHVVESMAPPPAPPPASPPPSPPHPPRSNPRVRRTPPVIKKKTAPIAIDVPRERTEGLLSLGGHYGYSTYALTSINGSIGNGNGAAAASGFSGNVPRISSGFPFSIDVRYGVWKGLGVGLDLSFLQADTSGTYSYQGGTESVTEKVSSTGLSFLALYTKPLGAFNLYGGAGPILFLGSRDEVSVGQSWGSNHSGAGIVYEDTGVGFGMMGILGAEYLPTDWFAVGIEGGYRYAPPAPLTAASTGQSALLSDGSPRTLDLSGVWVMGGIRLYFSVGSLWSDHKESDSLPTEHIRTDR